MSNLPAVHVIACPHPFKLAHEEHSLVSGQSLWEILLEVQPDISQYHAHVWVDDAYIPSVQWRTTYPRPGAEIAIRVVPSGGGAGRIIGQIFLAIAVIAVAALVTWATLGTLGPVMAPIAGALVGAIFGVVGSMALNALCPPVQPGGPGTLSALAAAPGLNGMDSSQSSPTLSITGARNKANLWGPVPFILGRFRVAPFYGASIYTESAGGDQYLRLFFVRGIK